MNYLIAELKLSDRCKQITYTMRLYINAKENKSVLLLKGFFDSFKKF